MTKIEIINPELLKIGVVGAVAALIGLFWEHLVHIMDFVNILGYPKILDYIAKYPQAIGYSQAIGVDSWVSMIMPGVPAAVIMAVGLYVALLVFYPKARISNPVIPSVVLGCVGIVIIYTISALSATEKLSIMPSLSTFALHGVVFAVIFFVLSNIVERVGKKIWGRK